MGFWTFRQGRQRIDTMSAAPASAGEGVLAAIQDAALGLVQTVRFRAGDALRGRARGAGAQHAPRLRQRAGNLGAVGRVAGHSCADAVAVRAARLSAANGRKTAPASPRCG